jgi:hypothetical protein
MQLVQDCVLNQDLQTVLPNIVEHLVAAWRPRLEAIVLTGSFARGEGSALRSANCLQVLGDMEFMLFYSPRTNLTVVEQALAQQAKWLSCKLREQRVHCELEFSPVKRRYINRLQPHIFGHELLTHGRVIWGKSDILDSASAFPASSIPRWDAWRMLNNRLLEQLQWVTELENGERALLERAFYQILKCYIDIGTTLLIFAARYQPTYATRAAELIRWSEMVTEKRLLPFLPLIADRVAACTAFKLAPASNRSLLGVQVDGSNEELRRGIKKLFADLVPLAHEVWRWEGAQLIQQRESAETDDDRLRTHVLRSQRVQEKVRGWAKIALISGVRSQRGFAKRMSILVGRGSPRYLIYSIASQLYFKSPSILKGEEPEVSELESLLPVIFAQHEHERRSWWRLRANVLSSWQLFLRNHWA